MTIFDFKAKKKRLIKNPDHFKLKKTLAFRPIINLATLFQSPPKNLSVKPNKLLNLSKIPKPTKPRKIAIVNGSKVKKQGQISQTIINITRISSHKRKIQSNIRHI